MKRNTWSYGYVEMEMEWHGMGFENEKDSVFHQFVIVSIACGCCFLVMRATASPFAYSPLTIRGRWDMGNL